MYDKYNKLMDKLFDIDRDDYIRVEDATSRVEEIDGEEWDEIYDSVGDLGKKAMDAFSHDFADGAIGDSSWKNGTGFED